jgi:hypothetical protein
MAARPHASALTGRLGCTFTTRPKFADFPHDGRWHLATPTGFGVSDMPPHSLLKRRSRWHRMCLVPFRVEHDVAVPAWCQPNVEVCGGRAQRCDMARRFRPSAPLPGYASHFMREPSNSLVAQPREAFGHDGPKLSVPQHFHLENSRLRLQSDGVAPPCTRTALFRMSCKNGSPHRRPCDEPHRLTFRLWFPLLLTAESTPICQMHCLCGVCYRWSGKQRASLARRSPRLMPIHKGIARFGSWIGLLGRITFALRGAPLSACPLQRGVGRRRTWRT